MTSWVIHLQKNSYLRLLDPEKKVKSVLTSPSVSNSIVFLIKAINLRQYNRVQNLSNIHAGWLFIKKEQAVPVPGAGVVLLWEGVTKNSRIIHSQIWHLKRTVVRDFLQSWNFKSCDVPFSHFVWTAKSTDFQTQPVSMLSQGFCGKASSQWKFRLSKMLFGPYRSHFLSRKSFISS